MEDEIAYLKEQHLLTNTTIIGLRTNFNDQAEILDSKDIILKNSLAQVSKLQNSVTESSEKFTMHEIYQNRDQRMIEERFKDNERMTQNVCDITTALTERLEIYFNNFDRVFKKHLLDFETYKQLQVDENNQIKSIHSLLASKLEDINQIVIPDDELLQKLQSNVNQLFKQITHQETISKGLEAQIEQFITQGQLQTKLKELQSQYVDYQADRQFKQENITHNHIQNIYCDCKEQFITMNQDFEKALSKFQHKIKQQSKAEVDNMNIHINEITAALRKQILDLQLLVENSMNYRVNQDESMKTSQQDDFQLKMQVFQQKLTNDLYEELTNYKIKIEADIASQLQSPKQDFVSGISQISDNFQFQSATLTQKQKKAKKSQINKNLQELQIKQIESEEALDIDRSSYISQNMQASAFDANMLRELISESVERQLKQHCELRQNDLRKIEQKFNNFEQENKTTSTYLSNQLNHIYKYKSNHDESTMQLIRDINQLQDNFNFVVCIILNNELRKTNAHKHKLKNESTQLIFDYDPSLGKNLININGLNLQKSELLTKILIECQLYSNLAIQDKRQLGSHRVVTEDDQIYRKQKNISMSTPRKKMLQLDLNNSHHLRNHSVQQQKLPTFLPQESPLPFQKRANFLQKIRR